MAVPYIAILVGLYGFRNAWLTLLLYHGFIIIGLPSDNTTKFHTITKGWSISGFLLLVPPVLLIIPLFLLLKDSIFGGNILSSWLSERGLSGFNRQVFLVYFALVNPVLEESHWAVLRQQAHWAWIPHLAFAGYHILVLVSLLHPIWMGVTFVILFVVSWTWGITTRVYRGSIIPLLSHILADMAITIIVSHIVS